MAAVTDAALATAGNSYLAFYNAGALGNQYCHVLEIIRILQGLRGLLREQSRTQLRLQ